MKRFVFIFALTFSVLSIYAQPKHKHNKLDVPTENAGMPDSTANPKDDGSKRHKHDKLIKAADTLTSSDYMMSIERVNDKLNAIRDSAKLEFGVFGMGRKVDETANDINLIRQNIRGKQNVVNIKNLYLYQSFTTNLDNETDRDKNHLSKIYNRVYHAKLQLKAALNDSVFRVLYADTVLQKSFDKKLTKLERKWNRTDSTIKANIDTINALKIKIADNSINLSNMLSMMNSKLDKANKQLFGPETNCLWQQEKPDTTTNKASNKATSIFGNEQKAIGYYFSQTSGQRVFVVFLAILLFVWLFFKRKQVKTLKDENNGFSFLHLYYLNNHPVLALLVLLLCLMPFFDAYAPTSYVAIEYLILLTVASVVFFKRWKRSFWLIWLALVVLLVVNTVTYLLIEPTFIERLWLLAVHVGIIFFAILFHKKLDKEIAYYKWIRAATVIGIIITGLGVICNLFGRFSLAGIFGVAGIFAITQAVVLPVFIETFIEIILLQLQNSRLKKGITKPFDPTLVVKKVKIPFAIITIILWAIMLSSNLNIYHSISNGIVTMLTETRTIGSISFQLISVLLFFVIIWFAHVLQRLISFMFGETGSDLEDVTSANKGQHSKLLITRLLVLIGGYLLAIAASGLPIDKLTFLIGALGVGIGMGLQNVVNNFVSGIILIFDGSLQIGDEIEVSGQAGKVKEIGLRASTLNTADGAEVIIPNGNILSQNIVNWTFSNDQRRVMIEFSLSGKELDSNMINELINETLQTIPNVISKRKPVILYTKVNQDACWLTVKFWSTIAHVDVVKSEAMLQLNAAFATKDIKFE
ncbi:MAG: mechanosensitive ion channel [Paludibacteraceae bacterium]|nr:mechanosensitive ion channel [Paludibacteraceae bacterium]